MKRLLLLTGLLVVLIAIAWLSGMFGGPASTVDLPNLGIDVAQVSHIDVTNGDQHVSANRLDSGEWQIEEPVQARADTATVLRLLRQAGDMQLESIVSSNPERFSRFEVDSTGNKLTLKWGDRRLDLIVGKMGPDFQSRYVRLDGDDRVMLANGVPALSAKLDQWRDKVLWSVPATAITNVFVTNGESTYGIVKTETGRQLTSDSKELDSDSTEVAKLVGQLATMKVDGFETGLTIDSVLSDVTNKLQVEFADGKTESLFMSKRKSDVAVVRQGTSDVLKLYPYRLTTLTPPLDKLKASGKATESQ